MTKRMRGLMISVLAGGFAFSASANLLTNGSFETQPPEGNVPVGWTEFPSSWAGYCDDITLTNNVFRSTTAEAYGDGYYFIRRSFSAGQGPTNTSYSSIAYDLSALPAGTTALVLSVQADAYSKNTDIGNYQMYAALVFYDGANGTGNILGEYQTDSAVAHGQPYGLWEELSATVAIPTGALSYRVKGVVDVTTTLISNTYGAQFDEFSVTAIPESTTISMFIIGFAASFFYRIFIFG